MLLGPTSGARGRAATASHGEGSGLAHRGLHGGRPESTNRHGTPGKFGFQINRIIFNTSLSHRIVTLTKNLLLTRDSNWSVSFMW